jgi:hybrid cluster-associated redox disulfide protein
VPILDKKTNIASMLQDYPQTAVVLKKYNLGCIGCHGVKHETIERGAIAHGVDVNAFLLDLNAAL